MKTDNRPLLFYLLLLCFCCRTQDSFKERLSTTQYLIGTWEICVSNYYGIGEHPNHCPEITFLQDGTGVLEVSEPASKFQWRIENKNIYFSFSSPRDKKMFLSNKNKLAFEIYNNQNSCFFKLIDKLSNSWFLLSKEKECNIQFLSYLDRNESSLTTEEIFTFTTLFNNDSCELNVEFIEYRNEVLLEIVEKYPKLFVSTLSKISMLTKKKILTELSQPLLDVNIDNIIKKINGVKNHTEIKNEINAALVLAKRKM